MQRWLSTARKILQRYKLNIKKKLRTQAYSNYSTILDTTINHFYHTTTTTNHKIIKAPRTNHLKDSPITNYYHSSIPTLRPTSSASKIPIEQNIKIATGSTNKNVVPDINIPLYDEIHYESFRKQNIHHELNQKNSPPILFPLLHSTVSTKQVKNTTDNKKRANQECRSLTYNGINFSILTSTYLTLLS